MTKDFLNSLSDKLARCATWIGAWCKDNIDFAFVLAVFTETPRWTVTFMAINEPLWIGIPLGVLLAFATSKVWKYYYRTRSGVMLAFNILAIVLAMLVITPVLYAMMDAHPKDVDITTVLADWRAINPLRLAWAGGLALLTFVPLVQLAAVHGAQPMQKEIAPDAKPPGRKVQSDASKSTKANAQTDSADAPIVQPDKLQRALQLKSEGLSNAQIGKEIGKNRNQVGALLRSANGHSKVSA